MIFGAQTLSSKAWESVSPHPRLFANAARWETLNDQLINDTTSKNILAVIRDAAEKLLDQSPVEYVDKGAFWHGPMRQAQGRILSLAMMFRLTGEQRFLTRAKLEMKTMAELPTWYPQHFLDTAEGALGMAVGLDWLHDVLSVEERVLFEDALIEKALRVSLEDEAGKSWIAGSNNWTAVCHGGLVVAALAVVEREPALAKQIVDRALKNMPRYAELYAPAGAYSEGPDYWAYGTTFYALMAEALRMNFGMTYDLEKAPGFLQTADYTLQMTAPSGLLYNFADTGSSIGIEPILFWFARELKRDDLIHREVAHLPALHEALISGTPRGDASRMLPLALLWRDPSIKTRSATRPPLRWWSEGGSQPQAVMRSAWNDPRATFIGIKAGKADDSHAHMDIGSFILEANSVRWAVDLGRESYPHARANGMATDLFKTTQESKRWNIFRCGPESHNLLRFNNASQRVDGKAGIRPMDNGFMIDLTPVVSDQVSSAQRQFTLNPDRSVSIRDEWTTNDNASDVIWQWLTEAKAIKTDDGFVLKQSVETLSIHASASSALTFTIEDVSLPKNKFDSPNPGLTRLTIRLQTAARTGGYLAVTVTPINL